MNNIFLKIKKTLSILLIVQLLFINLVPAISAEEIATTSPTPTPTQEAITEVTPTTTPTSTETVTVTNTDSATVVEAPPSPTPTPDTREGGDPNRTASATSATVVGVTLVRPVETTVSGGNVGDTSINTGNATAGSAVITSGNENLSGGSAGSGSATVANSGNGEGSTNTGSAVLGSNDTTNQNNSAAVNNNLNQGATTGTNDSSRNVGNTSLSTGDANVTGTVITSVNTNVDGVMVSEFNIADNHKGDIILDFGANCVSGCAGSTTVANTGNGSGSTNTAGVDLLNTDNTFQNNDALIGNELVLFADSGNNTASSNTGGDTSITTGDANVSGSALTFANNNIAGDVVYAVVNIFGDLIGDIILTEEMMKACCGGNIAATNSGNGSGSTNNANIATTNADTTTQTNNADLNNTLLLSAQTGSNETSSNTGGDSSITTGDTSIMASVLNVVNTNIFDGNMWLVIVNEAGNWVGKLMGFPEGQNFAGSEGTEFTIDANGVITAANTGNGSDSVNNSNVTQNNSSTTTQNNNAVVNNSMNLSANTGNNEASRNTGGNSNITTGDARIIANIVNFVNNNIVGNGKLFVTVINVFGSWVGDFVGPGQTKASANNNQAAQGGNQNQNTQIVNNNEGSTSTNTTVAKTETQGGVIGSIEKTITSAFRRSSVAGSVSGNNSIEAADTQKVAGISVNKEADNMIKNNKLKINLAWLVMLVPFIGAVLITKKLITARMMSKKYYY
jgi:hypothetical protein